ncbi:hypothetical protein I7I50_05657 [Histoplasma capsulatum G186AR]|uniref:Uncharacterized protein n=1 Tax=Ajellomyces capsulatus TaxID=5037 RepID=A0A8H7ZAQ2_AJECA|nr:hypothetical protein I7I52_03917 [Histoplasma capsulatum]QSS76264.1 hypothetical protein I7I50_05657 [Histoplasma capsulatum G186AR]
MTASNHSIRNETSCPEWPLAKMVRTLCSTQAESASLACFEFCSALRLAIPPADVETSQMQPWPIAVGQKHHSAHTYPSPLTGMHGPG